jgi:hypothetical protein
MALDSVLLSRIQFWSGGLFVLPVIAIYTATVY